MRLPLLVTAALAVSAAAIGAGCLGAPGKTMTAREGLGDAEDTAREWAEGADLELVGIAAVEPFKRVNGTSPDGAESFEARVHLDGDPGDGRAPGWAYGFLAGGRCIGVVLAAGLGVLAEGYSTCDGDGATVGDWSVDSDEAAAILADEEEWPDLGEDALVFWELSAGDQGPEWQVEAETPGSVASASVDARTGEVLRLEVGSSEPFFEPVGPTPPSGASEGEMVWAQTSEPVVAGTAAEVVVELEGDGGFLVAEASVGLSVNAVGTVRIVVSGPGGELHSESLPNLGGGIVRAEFAALPPGLYTLRAEPGPGAAAAQVDLLLEGGWYTLG